MDMNSSEDEDDARVSPPSALPPPSVAAAQGGPELELNPAQWEAPLEGAPTQPQGDEDAEGEAHPIMVVAEVVDALSSDEDEEGILMDVDVLAAEDADVDAPNVSTTAMAECTAVLDQLLGSVVDAAATEGFVAPDADICAPTVSTSAIAECDVPSAIATKDLRTDPLSGLGKDRHRDGALPSRRP
jgi:hypothetical protein